jgi:hypothetical protein
MGLVVISEENQKTLMAHRISTADIYNRQGTLEVSRPGCNCAKAKHVAVACCR